MALKMSSNEVNYINAMYQAKRMVSSKIISIEDYLKIEEKMAKKYDLPITNLYRTNHLISFT